MIKFSIVIPMYNSEKYLADFLTDLLKLRNIQDQQLIFIDDGSEDGTRDLLHKILYKKMVNFKYVYKDNGGVSSARNVGLDYALNPYIIFLDSDDYLDVDFFEIASRELIATNADIFRFNYNKVYSDSDVREVLLIKEDTSVSGEEILLKYFLDDYTFNSASTQVIKFESIGKMRFNEEIPFGEDMLFNYFLYKNTKLITLSTKTLYNYVDRQNSASTGKAIENIRVRIKSLKRVYNLIAADHYLDLDAVNSRLLTELNKQAMQLFTMEKIGTPSPAEIKEILQDVTIPSRIRVGASIYDFNKFLLSKRYYSTYCLINKYIYRPLFLFKR